jgi:hypothetical protein
VEFFRLVKVIKCSPAVMTASWHEICREAVITMQERSTGHCGNPYFRALAPAVGQVSVTKSVADPARLLA